MTYEDGPWHVEVNGSGLLNSILNPEAQRTSQGKVNDYILQVGDKGGSWGVNLRFGIVTPTLYTDAQFVTAATPRQGVELALKTPPAPSPDSPTPTMWRSAAAPESTSTRESWERAGKRPCRSGQCSG